MRYWLLARNREDRKRIKRRTRDYMPDYTGHVALMLVTAIAVVWLLIIGIQAAYAQAERVDNPTPMYVCTEKGDLNVREWPEKDAPIPFTIARGTEILVHKHGKYWSYIERWGDYGWVRTEYLGDEPPKPLLTKEQLLEVEPD